MAATEVWQVPVEKKPGHADPFVVEVPKDELGREAAKPKQGFGGLPVEPAALKPEPELELAPMPELAFESKPDPEPLFEPHPASDSGFANCGTVGQGDGEEDYDESPTIVAQMPVDDEDDEDESPTIVVPRERFVLVRDEDGQRTELLPPCILGRGKAADKRVKGNLAISRKHAKLFLEDGLVMIQDLGSTNGTFVNGIELEGDQCEPIADGASVRLGTEDFTFHIESM